MMDKFKRLFNKAKWLKKAGILTLVLTMLLTLFNNGVLIKADDNVNANINFTSQIVEQINGSYVSISDVQSGKSFFLAIGYTISASGETSRYTNCTLSITLPSYVSFSGQTSDIQGTAFDEINYNINFEGTPYEERTLTITADELVPGQTGTLYLQMSFDNLKTPDGSVANFTGMTLTGSVVAGDSSPNFNEILVPEATVIATASQDWTVSKDVAKQNNNDYSIETINGKKYYSVDYRITAAPGKNISDIGNNYGRLNCTFVDEQGNKADGFMLVDTLPVAPVANGGAYNIEVYAGTTKSSENMLQEGEDYELVLNDDGSVKAIRIKYVSTYSDIKNDYTTAYVPDDAHVLTTYTINANYDYNAYRVLPVDEDKIPYLLDNKAEIKYLPVGESTYKTTNDNASVNVGWVDENAPVTNLTITKYLTVKGGTSLGLDEKFVFDQDKQDLYYRYSDSKIEFGLYSDQECTIPAVDFNGNTVGNSVALNKDGQVIFENMTEGTYYLKETTGDLPITSKEVSKIEIKNENNQAVVYFEGEKVNDGKIEVNNENSDNGYGYVAFNKVGTSATSSTSGPLEGVKFKLTNKNDTNKVYETYSNEDGLVLFEGIPAGEYLVEEDFTSGEYDQPATTKWDVSVKANQVNYPDGMTKDDQGMPYVVNSSSKGKLIIYKVDQNDNSKKLSGAIFNVYGPFASEKEANEAISNNSLGQSFSLEGNSESNALEKGYYVYKEVSAPEGYKLDNNFYTVQVKTQTLNKVTMENEQLGKLRLLKKGALVNENVNLEINLAGAKFHIYTNKNTSDDSLVKDENGNPVVIESIETINSEYNSNEISLPAGTYYLKEFAVPDGYQLKQEVIEVEVLAGKTTTQKIINQTDRFGYLQVQKVDSKTNQPISGVSFDLYNSNNELIETITTNALGVGQSSFLVAGSYYLVEKDGSSLKDYVVKTEHIDFTLQNNQVTDLIVANDHYVNYQLQKVSSLNEQTKLNGAIFTLYDSDGTTILKENITSDENGYITFVQLQPGKTYYYQETKAPDGYTLNSEKVKFVAPDVNRTDDNYSFDGGKTTNVPQGQFTITKTQFELDSSSPTPASRNFAYFPVLTTDVEADSNVAKANGTYNTLTTNETTGMATSKKLDAGKYWVVELDIGLQWEVDGGNNKQITVEAGRLATSVGNNTNIDFVNKLTMGKVAIKKVSSIDKNIAVKATFNVYKKVLDNNHDYQNDQVITTLTSSSDGKEVVSEYLQPGDYVLVETSVTGDYVLDSTYHDFTITAGKTNRDFVNDPLTNVPQSTIGIKKIATWKDSANGDIIEPLAGIKFNIYKAIEVNKDFEGAIKQGDKYYYKDGSPVTSIVSGEDVVYSSKLEPGYYYVEEELTDLQKQDYQTDVPQVVHLQAGKTEKLTFNNTPLKGKIKVTKVSNVDNKTRLNGADFDIYYVVDKDTPGATLVKAFDGKDYRDCYVVDSGLSSNIVSGSAIVYDEKGNGSQEEGIGFSQFIEDGKEVVLQEIKAPQYYGMVHEWYYVGKIEKQKISDITITNYPLTYPVGDKYDGADKRIDGAVIGLFSSNKGAVKFNQLSTDDQNQVINDKNEWTKYDLLQTAISTKERGFQFIDIDATQTYYVLELKAPENYNRDDTIYKATVELSGDAYILKDENGQKLSIRNYHFQQIWVKKVLDFAGKKTNLDGINFNVYPANIVDKDTDGAIEVYDKTDDVYRYVTLGNKVDTYTTGTISQGKDNGTFITTTLPAGLYVIEEVTDDLPEGITAPKVIRYAVHLETDKNNKDLYSDNVNSTNNIVNTTTYGKLALNKVASDNSNDYIKATFNIYQKDQDNDYSDNQVVTTITTTGTKDPILSDFLKPGDYVLVETSVEDGYVLNSEPIEFKIDSNKVTGLIKSYDSIDDAKKDPLIAKNVPKGNINGLVKKGTYLKDGQKVVETLKDVNFEVYHYQIENGTLKLDNPIATAKSNSNGELVFYQNGTNVSNKKWLEAGTYVLKETTVGLDNENNGFVSNSYLGKFEIEAGKTTNDVIEIDQNGKETGSKTAIISNDSVYGQILITKVDHYVRDQKLAGVSFDVFDSSGKKVDTITTNKDGNALTKLLPEGKYTVKEVNSLDGYFINDTEYIYEVKGLKVTSKDSNGSEVITNTMAQSIQIDKVDSVTGKKITNLNGAVFSLWDSVVNGNKLAQITCDSNSQEIIFTGLLPDTKYYLQEDNAPDGYIVTNSNRIEITTTNNGEKGNPVKVVYELENEPLGSLKIEKVSKWTIYDSNNTQNYPLANAEFTLYQDVNNDSAIDGNDILIGVKTSDEKGIVTFEGLKAGKYLFYESKVPDDFKGDSKVYEVTIEKGKENSVYTGKQAIVNTANKGRFSFTKTAPDKTPLVGATFQLQKEENGSYNNYLPEFTVTNVNGEFLSDILDPGNYRLVETKAPQNFEIMTPIDFVIEAGEVTFVTSAGKDSVVNQALGTISVTKYDDHSLYIGDENAVLAGVEFGLYSVDGKLIASKLTDSNGKITWQDVAAGDYYVQEITPLPGYKLDTTKYNVTVKANQSEVIDYLVEGTDGKKGTIINTSTMGRLVIKKIDDDTNKGLEGAVFKISKVNDGTFVPIELTTNKQGIAVSDLLPASKDGSEYLITEIKAPDGYSLDEKYHQIEKTVKVYPIQDEELINSKDNTENINLVTFKNYAKTNIMDINPKIEKYIIDNQQLISDKSVDTPLLDSSDQESFAIRNFAQGENDVPVSTVEVEDSKMSLYYVDENNDYVVTNPNDPYTIDSVMIYHANDKDENNIKAQVYYMMADSSKWQTNDSLIVNVPGKDQSIKIPLDNVKATKVKVVYFVENGLISEGFTSDGIDLDVTINKRQSDATANEIRRVSNQAKVIYNYTYKDESGISQNGIVEKASDLVNVYYPLNETGLPQVSLGIVAGQENKIYQPGDSIESTITVVNKSDSSDDDPDKTIIQPIISFDLPLAMTLNTDTYPIDDFSGEMTNFQVVVYNSEDASDGMVLTPKQYSVVYSVVEARIFQNGQLEGTGKETRKVTILLDDEFEFKPGMKITVKYTGTTSINDTSTSLYAPAYFTSGKITALSIENPYGNAFTVESSTGSNYNALVNDKTLDTITGRDEIDNTGEGLKYPNSVGIITINETNYLSIHKQVKGIYNDEYLNYNQIASTAPGEDLDYQITFKNGGDDEQSDRAISKARVVDILPFNGDSLVNRTDDNYTARSTTLEKAPLLNYVDVLNENVQYTLYYCVGDDIDSKFDEWEEEARTKYSAKEELPIVYNNKWSDSDWSSGSHQWIKASEYHGDLSLVSAFAIEFDFSQDLLEPGETVTIHVKMTAPEYGTDQIDEISNKLMANSALIAVLRNGSEEVLSTDITENREVKAQLSLPKGTIGDFAWYDINRNGLQDQSDVPVQGLKVTLHKYVTTYDKDGKLQRQEIFDDDNFTTITDSSGRYEFTNQDCNVLKSGKTDNTSTDPNDYVGDRYFEYRVEFTIPEDESSYTYVPTLPYVKDQNGNLQPEIDSNIGADSTKDNYCFTEYFALNATKLGDASLAGDTDLSLDAGFVANGSLGDYVWFDANKNCIQDPDESGVAGVTVRLYQANENGEIINSQALKTTKTDYLGYYLFEDLTAGYYIIEFDIDGVVPSYGSGYLDRYYFTGNNLSDDENFDSNPIITIDNQDTLVAKTGLIELEYHDSDMSIDAGLTVYSAISGSVFEDRDYSDTKNYLNENGDPVDQILKEGTIVQLYQVDEEFDIINELPLENQLISEVVVGSDGKYHFEQLDAGYYVVKFIFPNGYSLVSGDVGTNDTIDSDVVNQIVTENDQVSGYSDVIQVGLNEHVTNIDGGTRLYSSLGDYIFMDNNANGIQDQGDTPVSKINVYLFRRENENAQWQYYRQSVSDENGLYLFENLESSTYTGIQYRVIFDLGITTKVTIPYASDDQGEDSNALSQYIPGFGYPSDPIDLKYNTIDLSWDAGIVQSTGAIGDYVFYDSNVNGIQDEENTGISNIKVVLEANNDDITNENDWQEVATTYTNSQGYYIFNNLKEGYYRVKFEVLDNYNVTLSTQGEDSAIDSDGIYANDDIWYYTRSFYLDQDGYDMTWDLGVYDPDVTTTTITQYNGSQPTGDNINLSKYFVLALGSIAALVTTYFGRNKKKRIVESK